MSTALYEYTIQHISSLAKLAISSFSWPPASQICRVIDKQSGEQNAVGNPSQKEWYSDQIYKPGPSAEIILRFSAANRL